MSARTTTVWTCSRCGSTEECEGTGQPKDWVRVAFVNPPQASWSDKATIVGDLCNGDECGGLLIDFMHGTEFERREQQARLREAEERIAAEPPR